MDLDQLLPQVREHHTRHVMRPVRIDRHRRSRHSTNVPALDAGPRNVDQWRRRNLYETSHLRVRDGEDSARIELDGQRVSARQVERARRQRGPAQQMTESSRRAGHEQDRGLDGVDRAARGRPDRIRCVETNLTRRRASGPRLRRECLARGRVAVRLGYLIGDAAEERQRIRGEVRCAADERNSDRASQQDGSRSDLANCAIINTDYVVTWVTSQGWVISAQLSRFAFP